MTPKISGGLLDSYKSGLYLFGCLKVFKGRPLEKVFWAICMALIISLTTYIVFFNTVRYLNRDVRTEVRKEEMSDRKLPVITMCLESTLYEIMHCYDNKPLYPDIWKCDQNWTNTKMTYFRGKPTSERLQGKQLENGCHVFNENGSITLSRKEYMQVIFNITGKGDADVSDAALYLNLQSFEEYHSRKPPTSFFHITDFTRYMFFRGGVYQIEISEKRIKRLKSPYQSNCTDRNIAPNHFSEEYSYNSCQETCAFMNMYQECNDVLDYWQTSPTTITDSFEHPKYRSRQECIKDLLDEAIVKTIPNCECNLACNETIYTATDRILNNQNLSGSWHLVLYHRNAVTTVELHPEYPLDVYFAAFGGILGLGTKFMAALQLCIFLGLAFSKLASRKREEST